MDQPPSNHLTPSPVADLHIHRETKTSNDPHPSNRDINTKTHRGSHRSASQNHSGVSRMSEWRFTSFRSRNTLPGVCYDVGFVGVG